MTDFQDRGEAARRTAGIDGTAGDAQDIRHRFVRDDETSGLLSGGCLLCGLAETYRKHIDRLLDCGLCYEEQGEEVHPHPECPVGRTGSMPPCQSPGCDLDLSACVCGNPFGTVSAYSDLIVALAEHPCCFSEDDTKKPVDAHRDEVALKIGRDALRDGLWPTLNRLVGEANARKLLADFLDQVDPTKGAPR